MINGEDMDMAWMAWRREQLGPDAGDRCRRDAIPHGRDRELFRAYKRAGMSPTLMKNSFLALT